jgi:predicted Zn-dependent peptidase
MVFPPEHPYHHPVIGSMEDLDAATLDDVSEFFRTFYVPNNCVLTVCGDVEPEHALDRVRHWFGSIPPGDAVPPVPGRTDLEPLLGRTVRERVVSRVPLPRAIVACRIPAYTDPDFPTVEVLTSVLVNGKASRLYESLVRERRIAKDVVGYALPLITGGSKLVVWATGYADTDIDDLEEALLRELDDLDSVTEAEVTRAVALTDTAFVRAVERVSERADLLSMFETLFDDAGRLNDEMERIRAVTPVGVREFAARRLGEGNRAVLSYVPEQTS